MNRIARRVDSANAAALPAGRSSRPRSHTARRPYSGVDGCAAWRIARSAAAMKSRRPVECTRSGVSDTRTVKPPNRNTNVVSRRPAIAAASSARTQRGSFTAGILSLRQRLFLDPDPLDHEEAEAGDGDRASEHGVHRECDAGQLARDTDVVGMREPAIRTAYRRRRSRRYEHAERPARAERQDRPVLDRLRG